MTNNLTESASRHAIYTNRFAGHLANLFDPYSERLKRELRLIMLDAPETTQNIRRINQIVKEYRGISLALYGDYNEAELLTELSEFALSESEFAATTLNAVVKSTAVEITAPAPVQLWAAVNSTPLILPGTGGVNMLEPYIKEMEAIQVNEISKRIKIGFMTGRTSDQIARDIAGKNGYIDKQNRAKITGMVRTATNHVSNIARQKTYEENDDIVKGYEIVATLDGRTSDICKGYDGLIVKHGDKVKPMPPFHPNCVLEGTEITTCSSVNTLYKRAYKGLVVDLVTKSGRKLSITPNHPVLTRKGWKVAKLIDSTDQLATVSEDVLIGKDYKDSVKAEASDLFCAANISAQPALVANRPTTTEHFHGDGIDGEVSVIDIDRLAWDGVKSILNEKIKNNRFCSREFIDSALDGISSFYQRGFRNFSTSSCIVGGFSVGASFIKRHVIHSYLLLLGRITKDSKPLFENSFDGVFAAVQAEVLGNSPSSYSGFVSFDDVVSVDIRELDSCTHVYNLENKDNWYLSNGIITHNCRTTTAPVLDARFTADDDPGTRASAGVTGGKQVDASKSYYQWLKDQGAQGKNGKAFVVDVLGKERADLFLNGGLSIDKFKQLTMDELFRPLPLKDLRKKESLQMAFDNIDG